MKILVVSLLRLGDVLLTLPTLKGLRKQYPQCELHLLINKQFKGLIPLLDGVDKVHLFDRDGLQKMIGDPQRGILDPVDALTSWTGKLNSERFNLLINLTHNRLSGYLSAMIEADEKRGLVIEADEKPRFGSQWFRYLNEQPVGQGREIFHLADVYFRGAGLTGELSFHLRETENGKNECNEVCKGLVNPVVIQPLTSDSKKNWPMESWLEALRLFQERNSEFSLVVLGAEFERPDIEVMVKRAQENGISLKPAILSLEGAFSLLKRSRLLITGDTSIKHMACATDIPVIELSLGSSDFRTTGVYKNNGLIIQGQSSCAPCSHSQACHQPRQICAEYINPIVVAEAMEWAFQNKNGTSFKGSVTKDIYQVMTSGTQYWMAVPLKPDPSAEVLAQGLEKSTWKLLLNEEHRQAVGTFGSESLNLSELMKQTLKTDVSRERVKDLIGDLESSARQIENEMGRLKFHLSQASRNLGNKSEMETFLNELKAKCAEAQSSLWWPIDWSMEESSVSFQYLRRLQLALDETSQKQKIKLKLLRTLKSQMFTEIS